MKRILVLGAGRSTSTLINYLIKVVEEYNWELKVCDKEMVRLESAISNAVHFEVLDIFNTSQLEDQITKASIVVSMLPARFHAVVAKSCLKFSKHLVTASYESDEVAAMDTEVKSKNILFLNEMGVDPGIDHMSAMRIIDKIKSAGHQLLCFESFTGGLIAPCSDNNPWNYKFTWNPRNVVVAGQGGPARFIQEGKLKYIPYNRLFRRTERISIPGLGKFEGYANRDSLKYIEKYNLQDVPTVFRGTLRRSGFCRAWDVFVQLGATDDSYFMENVSNMTYKEFINSFLYFSKEDPVRTKLFLEMQIGQDSHVREKFDWLGLFDDTPIGLESGTPAQILEHILMQKWKLDDQDKDMIVMWHKFIYRDNSTGNQVLLTSSMGIEGDNSRMTAMSKTVGLPVGIAVKMILTGQINLSGVHIPNKPEIYMPVLNELEQHSILFREEIHNQPE